MRTVAIIPARSGSKGLSGKNTRSLAGKPLITWTLEAALAVFGDDVVVTSDCKLVAEIAAGMGIKLIERPSHLATDSALTEEVVAHVIGELRLADNDCFCLLQPTSPIRNKEHIDAAWSKFLSIDGADALISVTKTDNGVLKRFLIEDSLLRPIADSSYPFMPRQALPEVFAPNGAIYLCTVSAFRSGGFLGTACIPFEMDAESSIDIDNMKDFMLAQAVLLQKEI